MNEMSVVVDAKRYQDQMNGLLSGKTTTGHSQHSMWSKHGPLSMNFNYVEDPTTTRTIQ